MLIVAMWGLNFTVIRFGLDEFTPFTFATWRFVISALPIEEVEQLADEMRASPGNARVTVDLENCQVVSPTGRVIPFKVDARRQHALLNGLDDIAQTMTHKDKVEAWQASDKNARPWVWL